MAGDREVLGLSWSRSQWLVLPYRVAGSRDCVRDPELSRIWNVCPLSELIFTLLQLSSFLLFQATGFAPRIPWGRYYCVPTYALSTSISWLHLVFWLFWQWLPCCFISCVSSVPSSFISIQLENGSPVQLLPGLWKYIAHDGCWRWGLVQLRQLVSYPIVF